MFEIKVDRNIDIFNIKNKVRIVTLLFPKNVKSGIQFIFENIQQKVEEKEYIKNEHLRHSESEYFNSLIRAKTHFMNWSV